MKRAIRCSLLLVGMMGIVTQGFCKTVALYPQVHEGKSYSVSIDFQVGGDLEIASGDNTEKLPMSVVATLRYDEAQLPAAETGADNNGVLSPFARKYKEAKATIKVGDGGTTSQLSASKRFIAAEIVPTGSRLVCPTATLAREELELIDVPFATHLLDQLIPSQDIEVGGSWKHSAEVVRLLLGMESATVCEVESVLVSEESGYARIRLAGRVEGATDGAPTSLEVKAGYLVDLSRGQIVRLNANFREQRKQNPLGPAVDVTAQLKLQIDPAKKDLALTDEEIDAIRSTDVEQQLLEYVHSSEAIKFKHDRQWHLTGSEEKRINFRRIEYGDLIAQCAISVLPVRSEGKQDTLQKFQKDVRFSLKKNFEQLVSARQWQNRQGMQCYQVIAHGSAEGVPIEWRYYRITPKNGHRVSMVVSVERSLTDRLDNSDTLLAETMWILENVKESSSEVSKTSAKVTQELKQ